MHRLQSGLPRLYFQLSAAASCLVNPQGGTRDRVGDRAGRRPPTTRCRRCRTRRTGLRRSCRRARARGRVVRVGSGHRRAVESGAANPGKNEFDELLRYFKVQLTRQGVELRLGTLATATRLRAEGVDHVIVATGSVARPLKFGPIDAAKTATYKEVILGRRDPGRRVAIIGTGGIAHDVGSLLTDSHPSDVRDSASAARFLAEWGVDTTLRASGGLKTPERPGVAREVTLFQRSVARPALDSGSRRAGSSKANSRPEASSHSRGASTSRSIRGGCTIGSTMN